jgi:hypothetical protein
MPNKTEFPLLVGEDERACCDSNGEQQQPDHKPPGCVDSWEAELRKADNAYRIASAEAEKAGKAYDNASLWESRLKDWIDNADGADEKANKVADQLALFEAVVVRLETNSTHTAEGVEILLCLVKKIFDSVQDILRLNVTEPQKKRLLYTLKRYIECNPDLDEKKKQAALECIAPYEKAINVVNTKQDELLNKLLQMLSQADKVATALGIPDESSDESTKDLGLLWQIRDLLNRIKGESTASEKVDKCGCRCTDSPSDKPDEISPPCGEDILVPDQPLLPIKRQCPQDKMPQQQQADGTGNDYYCELQRLLKEANARLTDSRDALAVAQKECDRKLARRNSLDAAKKAADEAKAAK